MITDKELLETWPSRSDMDINDKKIWFARQVIRMAQEVRPLVWVSCGSDEIHALKNNFKIRKFKDRFSLYYRTTLFGRYPTIEDAKSAAQRDHDFRVLANLVHGDAE